MFSSAEKTTNVNVQRQQQPAQSFFRKAEDSSFFGAEKQTSFFSPNIQAKLSVSSPDDPQEKEADAVADKVMRMPEPVAVQSKEEEKKLDRKEQEEEKVQAKFETPAITVQRKCDHCEKEEKTQAKLFRMIQRSEEVMAADEADTAVQAKQISLYRSDIFKQSGRGPPANSIQPSFEQSLSSSKGNGTALPIGTQQFMESRFNADFSGVRIHTGSYAQSLSSNINAQAFAHGNDIYFNSGKYSPNTEAGGTLLAHELTHTVQQGASPVNFSTTVAAKTASKNIAQTKVEKINPSIQNETQSSDYSGQYNMAAIWQQQSLLKRNGTNVKPQPLEKMRQQIPNINRSEENENKGTEQSVLQTKSELSNWHVNNDGALQTAAPVIQKQTGEKELQKKEEELQKEEDEISALPVHDLQAKAMNEFSATTNETSTEVNHFLSNHVQTKNSDAEEMTSRNAINSSDQINTAQERGPPLVQRLQAENDIHRSVIDDALNFVSGSSLLGCISIVNPASTGPCLLAKARDVALHIPGYRALRVVLGNDPITGEHIERNGHNFIEAAFDIMPGGMLLHQKLQEQGQLDDAAAWIDGKIEELDSIVSTLTSSFSHFWNGLSFASLSSPMDVIREGAGIVFGFIGSITRFAITAASELLEMVKNFLLNAIVDFIKERTTAYPLLTVILGEDPITKQAVTRNGTNILNALLELGGEEGIQQRTQMQETGTFQRIVGYIDEGIAVFGNLYQTIVNNFMLIWDAVSIDALIHPLDTFTRLYNVFAVPIGQVLDFVRRVAVEILKLIKEILMQRLSAWARQQRGYALVTVIIGKDPFTDAEVPFTMENVIKGFFSLMEGGEEQYNQLKESGVIDRTVAKITAAVARLNMTPQAIVQLFIGLWNSLSIHDLVDPIAAFRRIIDTFGEPIGRLINFVVEIVKIVVEAILIVMNFPFDLINNIIRRAMAAMDKIKRDPVAFLKNLLRAIKQGFIQFFDNILTHLMNGVVGWLMSELRDANIPPLTDFSLRGVIGWVLQVLGISMEAIWTKLAAHPRIGPQRVARIRSMISTLDGIWTFIKDVQERGMAAIWDKIQEQLTNLWDTVIDAVKNWITEQIVNRVLARLLSMLDPTGIMAVVNSAIAIYSAIQSFIRYLREILEVINSFVNGVADIAEGNVTTAANYLERTMGRAMPIVIGFLANQVGLSGIGRRVGEMIERVRTMVDNALTWLVNRAVDTGMSIIDRLMAMGRGAVNAVLGWLGIRKEFTATNGESHEMYFEGANDESSELWVASRNPQRYSTFLQNINTVNDPNKATKKQEAIDRLAEVQTAKRQPLTAGIPEEQARTIKYDNVNTKVIALSVPTAHLFGGPLRPLEFSFGPANGAGFATNMTIRNLNKNNKPPVGGPPRVTNEAYRKLNLRKNGDTTYYIKGHLLNGYLGGTGGDFRNLTPLSRTGNGSHESQVESPIIAQVDAGKTVEYIVTPTAGAARVISDSQLQNAGVPVTKWDTIKEIITAENNVPAGLSCVANVLDDATGQPVSTIISTSVVPNPIDTNLSNYQT